MRQRVYHRRKTNRQGECGMNRWTKRWSLGLVVGMGLLVSGCTDAETDYTGKELRLAAIGADIEIEAKQVTWDEVTLDQLTEKTIAQYDGVVIGKEQLQEASADEWVEFYRTVHTPIFFIGSEKGITPFLEKGLAYDDEAYQPELPEAYAVGFLKTENESLFHWSTDNEKELLETIEKPVMEPVKSTENEPSDSVPAYLEVEDTAGEPVTKEQIEEMERFDKEVKAKAKAEAKEEQSKKEAEDKSGDKG